MKRRVKKTISPKIVREPRVLSQKTRDQNYIIDNTDIDDPYYYEPDDKIKLIKKVARIDAAGNLHKRRYNYRHNVLKMARRVLNLNGPNYFPLHSRSTGILARGLNKDHNPKRVIYNLTRQYGIISNRLEKALEKNKIKEGYPKVILRFSPQVNKYIQNRKDARENKIYNVVAKDYTYNFD